MGGHPSSLANGSIQALGGGGLKGGKIKFHFQILSESDATRHLERSSSIGTMEGGGGGRHFGKTGAETTSRG